MTVFMKRLVQSKSSAYLVSYCATLALDYTEATVFRVWDKMLSFLNKLVVNGIWTVKLPRKLFTVYAWQLISAACGKNAEFYFGVPLLIGNFPEEIT